MSKDIVLIACFGDEVKEVLLTQPMGAGGGYHIMMDKYYHGQLVKTSHGWKGYINPKSLLSHQDGEIMCDIAERNAEC